MQKHTLAANLLKKNRRVLLCCTNRGIQDFPFQENQKILQKRAKKDLPIPRVYGILWTEYE